MESIAIVAIKFIDAELDCDPFDVQYGIDLLAMRKAASLWSVLS